MNKHLYAIGDIHGDFGQLKQITNKYKKHTCNLVQLGDLGLGFPAMEKHHGIWIPVNKENNDPKEFPNNFKFIRGNHDEPVKCSQYSNYLGDFGFNKDLNIFYISGGASHDKALRTENIDWWPEEELSIGELHACLDLYNKIKPEIVISHEPPVVAHAAIRKGLEVNSSRTSQALQAMWEIHQPKQWFFGHHHLVWSKQINKTKFTCVAINQVVKVY